MDEDRDLIKTNGVRGDGGPPSAVSSQKNVRTGFTPLDIVSPLPLKCVIGNRRTLLKFEYYTYRNF
jgi:hypothetical protein